MLEHTSVSTITSRGEEEVFFEVLRNDNIWKELKKWMYPYSIKNSNFYDYKDGDLAVLRDYVGLIKEREDLVFTVEAIDNAAQDNNFELLQWLYYNRIQECTVSAMDNAAENGNLEMFQFLASKGKTCSIAAMDNAASTRQLEMVLFLHYSRSEGCTTNAMDWAIGSNDIEIVKFLHYNRTEGCTSKGLEDAATWNSIDIIEFLVTHKKELVTRKCIEKAGRRGDLDIFKLFFECRKQEWDLGDTLREACTCGKLSIVEYLVSNGIKPVSNELDFAAYNGRLDVVKYLHRLNVNATDQAMDCSMSATHYRVAKFLYINRKEGYTEKGIACVIGNGGLEFLSWLHNNAKDNEEGFVLNYAKVNGHTEVVKYLESNQQF